MTDRMPRTVPAKFDPWNWLLFTQYVEAVTSDTDEHKAAELADLLGVTMEYIEVLGYDPVAVFRARVGDKAPDVQKVLAVFEKYAEAYHAAQREMRRWPNK